MEPTNNESGVSQLYDALNKKAMEMAQSLNKTNLNNVDLENPKDKTFDRLRAMWNDCTGLAEAIKALGELTGKIEVKKDGDKKPFVNTIAEDRK